MNPTEVPEWLKSYGPLGGVLWLIYVSLRAKTPDNPPKPETDKHDNLAARVAHLETEVAVLKDRSERTQ